MPLTNFPNGVTSFGVPVLPGSGLSFTGKQYFVDPAHGSDSNSGTTPAEALDTIAAAYAKCTSGHNDVVWLIGDGSTTGSARPAAAITWAKNATHLIGVCAPTGINQRARIAPTDNFATLFTLSGSGCYIANVQFYHGYAVASAQKAVVVSGSRNCFSNVHIAGMADATSADQAGGRSLSIEGGSENRFVHCTIGLDTVNRSTSNSEIAFTTAAARNVFEDCTILSAADNAGHLFVDASSVDCIQRFVIFKDCLFLAACSAGAGYTTMTVGMNTHVSMGGVILLMGSTAMLGCTDVADDFTNVYANTTSGHATYAQGMSLLTVCA